MSLNAVPPTANVLSSRKQKPRRSRRHRKQLHYQTLESRQMLAGDVTADFAGGTLVIEGDDSRNVIRVDTVSKPALDTFQASSGVTSVFLDPAVLALVGLEIDRAENTVEPASDSFLVGFEITESTDFELSTFGGFTPLGGSIEHSGTVVLDIIGTEAEVTVGDFSIGFDPARAGELASGFFVEDTASGLGILFDVGAPGSLELDDDSLSIGQADLLIAPEFASFLIAAELAEQNFSGADAGDAQVDADLATIAVRGVEGGKTSVGLNVELLASVGLQLTSANGTADPASDRFQVAFAIDEDSDFLADVGEGLIPLGGTIDHTGTVGFNEGIEGATAIVVGDFSIGFDPLRVSESASGFFVEDTVGGLGVLFDVGAPGTVAVEGNLLTVGDAALLVSSDLATALGNADLTGVPVGSARIDALAARLPAEYIRVRATGPRGNVNGARYADFPADLVDNLVVNTGTGRDSVLIRDVSLAGDLTVELGSGRSNRATLVNLQVDGVMSILGSEGSDRIRIANSATGELEIDAADGRDLISMLFSEVEGDATIDLGAGHDRLTLIAAKVGGDAFIDGGTGRDRLYSLFGRFGSLDTENLERRWVLF